MDLSPEDEGHSAIAFTGEYEHDLTLDLLKFAALGGLLVDVGANYGYFSLLWAARRQENRVIAFEASPRNHAALERNVRTNGFEPRISVRKEAVGKETGKMLFDLGPPDQTGWGGLSLAPTTAVEQVCVRVVKLDDQLADVSRIDVMKIDIEGADTWAIAGAENLLREKRIKHLFFEQNRFRLQQLGIDEQEAPALLRRHGYRLDATGTNQNMAELHAYLP
jgi:FkbM family methyltransferase